MSKDYYKTIGVDKKAGADEIRKAYYKLAHQHHPHKGGDEAKMKEINEAYGVLGNQEKRSQYDQFGSTFEQARSQGGSSGFGDFSGFARNADGQPGGQSFSFEFGDLGDLFGDLFGGGRRGQSRRASRHSGQDIQAELAVNFSEAVFGTEKVLRLEKEAACQTCGGSGAEPGSKVITCKTCGGSGQVVRNIGFGLGFPSVCPDCEGFGQKVEKECFACRGQGRNKQTRDLNVKIPAGIDHGQTIRLSGKGQAGTKGGEAGDLYLKIKIAPDARFARDGYNILTKAKISFTRAALGGKIEIETLDGKLWLKIPEGTQAGKVFRLKGRGVPVLHGRGRGDQLVEVIVETPVRLSRRQKELLRELGEAE
ncbi:MAG: molecular chaperone DnaJ [Candidatus Buchananbacteria bacterium RIFCSPHIGHO2_02_FULL_45_11b]|uniref:Chaperone protein DnaJ n=2 Tax=Candidatus Buchananiibacteriota TaxID=1817903 RepID=A0A1G1YPE2_9BACT|nr:MAG: molecular chaperone DnaJ [Candidatus Buchananbacteria bacterium RIFCSPHIGHO2_02_FULL_45_11b]OGY54228.1 MAG: molecular chaperone DnaJ [Candidatus Buchananbacteria bacterium RIFCSPLOWO2_01_FULL_45_31]